MKPLGSLRMGAGCQGGATRVIRVVTFSPTHLNHHLQERERGWSWAVGVSEVTQRTSGP